MTVGLATGTSHVASKLRKTAGLRMITRRFVITFILALMVISSPVFNLTGPIQVSAATTSNPNGIDTSAYHSNMPMSETSSSTPTMNQNGDFSTQAALSLTRASQTNNFVSSKSYYDISFRTATAGVIKSVVMDFPPGTAVGSALIVEATGIGPGTLAASAGEALTYTVTNAVNVPALTNIRIQISNINNPPNPSASLTISITTRDTASTPIDGPTPTTAFNMVQVGNSQIAPGAVTTTKIANGAVTSGDIANGAVTGNKIAGIQKLLFAQCTLPDGAGTLTPGQSMFVSCSVPGAQIGDLGVAEYLGNFNNNFWSQLIVVGMDVNLADTVILLLRNDNTQFNVTLDGEIFSIILFRK